jgi:hypothetical protein
MGDFFNKKICACCGKEYDYDNDKSKKEFLEDNGRPIKEGASRDYFDLWNFAVESCPFCSYSALDISAKVSDDVKNFCQSLEYKKELASSVISTLSEYRENTILDYLSFALIKEHLGDLSYAGRAYLQVSDQILKESFFYSQDIQETEDLDDEDEKVLQSFSDLADKYFEKGLSLLKKKIDSSKNVSDNLDDLMVYIGSLGSGNEKQLIESNELIIKYSTIDLPPKYKNILTFIKETNNSVSTK